MGGNKKQFVKNREIYSISAKITNSKKTNEVELCLEEKHRQRPFPNRRSDAFSVKRKAIDSYSHADVIKYPNSSIILLDNDNFRNEVDKKLVNNFISSVIQDQPLAAKFINDESILKEDVFTTTCTSVANEWGVFNELRQRYENTSARSRQSDFAKKLKGVVEIECDLKSKIMNIMDINTAGAIGLDCLIRNANIKKEALLNLTRSLLSLKLEVTNKELLYSLRRRVRQIMETKKYLPTKNELVKLVCRNDCTLTWGAALDLLTEFENGNSFVHKRNATKFLTVAELISISNLLKDSSAVSENELLFYLPSRLQKEVDSIIEQLCTHLPILILHKATQRYVINMFQIDFDCDELNSIFETESSNKTIPEAGANGENSKGKGRCGGRKSILNKFPTIPDAATEFIKANGFKAQERRRETTITSCGVSVQDIRDHLLEVIPGLKEHGLSVTTVRYLFKPVKKSLHSAERYKSAIDARVPRKDNSEHSDNLDAHYLLGRIKLRRELAASFPDECTVVSVDSMNKIKYGTLAVSRYHQIRKIYMSNDKPKYLDHDFPLPYKTIPDGIMILSNNKNDDLFVDDDIVLEAETTKVNILSHLEATALVTENHIERLANTLFRAAYELDQHQCAVFQCMSLELSKKGFDVSGESLKSEVIHHIAKEDPSAKKKIEDAVYSSEILDQILWSIAEIYDVKIVLYNSITPAPVVILMNSATTNVISLAFCYANGQYVFYNISAVNNSELKTFADYEDEDNGENARYDENDSVLDANSSKTDNLGRIHVSYPHTGPSIVYLRNNYFHSNTCLEHVNDLLPIIKESVKRGKTCFTMIADGGPDYNPNSYKNEMLYAKLWEESGLDMLTVTCNAAGWSAMNPIEHLWSPLSSSLTSVKLKCSVRDDGVAPCNDTKLSKEEQISQNKEILEQGAKDISAYWGNMSFDGHPVVTIPVSCDGRPGDAFKSASYIM